MDLDRSEDSEARFARYVAGLADVIGHANRARPLRDYCTGLILPGERKSVEPMAARTAPARTAAQHQSLLHFVGNARWSDEEVLAKVREMVLPAIEKDTWQLACLPSCPQYWWCTPTECLPCFGNEVSSMIHASSSRPSQRSRWSRYAGHAKPVCRGALD
ncbi:hypothetical protein ACVMIH_007621 [Bradyrhizobium sp. USDA 4503]